MEKQREFPDGFVMPDRLINASAGDKRNNTDQSKADEFEDKKRLKRPRTVGRPKNGWTTSRKRKLVRLYLNTDLEVNEIRKLLETNSFHPCKRDIQKHLNNLLQHRPNRIRPKGKTAKERIQLLMECKTLKSSRKSKPRPLGRSTTLELQTQEPDLSFDQTDSLDSTPLTPFVRDVWPSLFPDVEVITTLPYEDFTGTSPDMNADLFGLGSDGRSCYGEIHDKAITLGNPCLLSHVKLNALVPGQVGNQLLLDSSQTQYARPTPTDQGKKETHFLDDNESVLSHDQNDDSSIPSFRSPKERLNSKHSMSSLDDVKSLIERLTVSDSDTSSIRARRSASCSPTPSWTTLSGRITLPGGFPKYCWNYISKDERLIPCDDLPCNHMPMFDSLGTYHKWHWPFDGDHQSPLQEDGFLHRCTDIFGNSVLHMAAAVKSPLSLILSLIVGGADVSCVNSANQTFLHLMDMPLVSQIDEYLCLLENLHRRDFPFGTQDLTGQRVPFLMLHPKLSHEVFAKILGFAKSHNLEWVSYCENLEHATQSSICQYCDPCTANIHEEFNISHASLQESRTFETIEVQGQGRDSKHPSSEQVSHLKKGPREYEYHANLLKTIRKAGNQSKFEDDNGRNGLHCLSEVCLDLPIPSTQLNAASGPTERRHEYIKQLLQAGVNPNHHDKNGITPFMAFVLHSREDEDDSSTNKVLETLFEAGANIHRRNAQGETALHLAVKLGRRAATKFLLSHHANLHARTLTGQGILALGYEYSQRAAHNEILYAQISLCMSLVATAGAVSAPTLIDEWAIPQLKHTWMNSSPEEEPLKS